MDQAKPLNVYGLPLSPCGAKPGSGDGDHCIARSRWVDAGFHQICVPSLPAEFSVATGQTRWSESVAGQPWCICIWALLAHRRLVPLAHPKRLAINCTAIPVEALDAVVSHGAAAPELCATCAQQAPSLTAAEELERRCEKALEGGGLGRAAFIFKVYGLLFGMVACTLAMAVVMSGQTGQVFAAVKVYVAKCFGVSWEVVAQGEAEGPCRICHGDDGDCVSVCECKGSVAAVHLECLERWRHSRPPATVCEICHATYDMRRIVQGTATFRRGTFVSAIAALLAGGLMTRIGWIVRL
eukprot:TRINITY_DN76326_c0_g1_i1.p1 TRINITY_DN76326_c0_g1~~TRINITY_DN76326_c0_g1_i1.p1  ORF type:complete len:297 (+),score=29.96 TRINITY_DN76326_c0_g1_i1:71-961(+)